MLSNSRTQGYSVQFVKSSLNLNRIIMFSLNNCVNSSLYEFSNYDTPSLIQYCFAVMIKALTPKFSCVAFIFQIIKVPWLLFCTDFPGSMAKYLSGLDYSRGEGTQSIASWT